MFIFFLIVLLLIPVTMLGFGLLWKNHSPKTINIIYGYRTTRSMKSNETWYFAHKYIGAIWFYAGIAFAIISMILLIFFESFYKDALESVVLIITFVQIVSMIASIVPTEMALKKRFDENGHRK